MNSKRMDGIRFVYDHLLNKPKQINKLISLNLDSIRLISELNRIHLFIKRINFFQHLSFNLSPNYYGSFIY